MTKQECEWLLANVKGPLVRIDARSRPGHSVWMRARLLGCDKYYAHVQPMGHKKIEKVLFDMLKPWNAKNELAKPLSASIGELARFVVPAPMTEQIAQKEEVVMTSEKWIPGNRKYSDQQIEEIKKLRAMGKKFDDIAKITGVSVGSCYAYGRDRSKPKRAYTKRTGETLYTVTEVKHETPAAPQPSAPVKTEPQHKLIVAIHAVHGICPMHRTSISPGTTNPEMHTRVT